MFLCVFCFLCYELVFESKVLQKLYPAAPKLEKEPSPPRFVETLAKNVKRKASQEDTAAGKIIFCSHTCCLHKSNL